MYARLVSRSDAVGEVLACKRLRWYPEYFDLVDKVEIRGDYVKLLSSPSLPVPVDAVHLLQALQRLQSAKLVHRRITLESIQTGRLADFRDVLNIKALQHAHFYDDGAPDLRALSKPHTRQELAQALQNWKTWDLYALSLIVPHPLAARCLHPDPSQRPSVAECLEATGA